MFLSNCHTHTVFCDGNNTAEEMVQEAISLGFKSLGFSVHSPMNIDNYYALKPERVGEYINTILSLKEKYKDKIEIYNGIELDSNWDYIDPDKFDYIIGSMHHLHCPGKIYGVDETEEETKECVQNEFGGDWLAYAKSYYSALCEYLCKLKPDVVGHFDLIEKFNDKQKLFDSTSTEYQMIVKAYLSRICDCCPESIFEVNTGAMFRLGNENPYPAKFILEFLKQRGMRITISSDAHCTEALAFEFEKAEHLCRECGFNEVYMLRNGRFEAVEI